MVVSCSRIMLIGTSLILNRNIQPMSHQAIEPKFLSSTSMRAWLNFIVPIWCIVSIVPVALAWSKGDSDHGTAADSDFFQTVAGSLMQLLGLITFIWPTLSHPRLVGQTWWLVWILAVFSAFCAVLSSILYLFVATPWSFAVGFAGSIAQAVVQLQVINAV